MFEENNFNIQENVGENTAPQQDAAEQTPKNQPETNVQADTASYAYQASTSNSPYRFIPEEYREKKDIRRIALGIGIPCLCLSAITFVWSFAYLFFTTTVAGMSYSEAIELSQNPAMQQIMQIILSCIMFLVPFTIAVKAMGMRIDRLIKFGKAKKGTFLPFLFFGIGFCSFANIAMSYADSIFQSFGIDYEVDFGDNPEGFLGFLLSFIATAIVPALVEEFACRGIVLGLLKKYGEGFAIITSAIVFGIMHGNFEQIPFAVMVGLILGYIYVKTESIWVCVAVHCANNAVSVIFTYLENLVTANMQNLLYMVYLIVSMLAAVVGIYLLSRGGNENYSLKKAETVTTTKKKYTYFFTSWAIIAFIIFNLLESLTYFIV